MTTLDVVAICIGYAWVTAFLLLAFLVAAGVVSDWWRRRRDVRHARAGGWHPCMGPLADDWMNVACEPGPLPGCCCPDCDQARVQP